MTIANKIEGNLVDLKSGESVVIGFYDEFCNKYTTKLSRSNLQRISEGIYQTNIGHDITKNFVGDFEVQVAIVGSNDDSVIHAKNKCYIYFEERKLNDDYECIRQNN